MGEMGEKKMLLLVCYIDKLKFDLILLTWWQSHITTVLSALNLLIIVIIIMTIESIILFFTNVSVTYNRRHSFNSLVCLLMMNWTKNYRTEVEDGFKIKSYTSIRPLRWETLL